MKITGDSRGFSLVEMLIVIGIILILLTIAVPAFNTWLTKYNVEDQIKQIYSDLQTARSRALYTKRMHFVTMAGTNQTIYDDTSPLPYGDQVLTIGLDTQIQTRNYSSAISTSVGFPPNLSFDSRGLSNIGGGLPGLSQAICVLSTANPDYDCIVVTQSSMNMGKLNPGGACDVAKCGTK